MAIKILDKSSINNQEDCERMAREIKILKRIRNQFCIQLYDIHESPAFLYFVMEYPDGAELYDRIVDSVRYALLTADCPNPRQPTTSFS